MPETALGEPLRNGVVLRIESREELELLIEALIALLDEIDPDPDLEEEPDREPEADAEPALGAPEGINQGISWGRGGGNVEDLEEEHDGCEPEQDCDDPGSEDVPLFCPTPRSQAVVRRASYEVQEALQALLRRIRSEAIRKCGLGR
jgi:hypothetical protein